MFYIIYKVTNNLNNKFYVGCHKTNNINDGYYGSGKIIKSAIKKYGIENFTKEILFEYDNADDMFNKEAEIVNEEFLKNELTYNLKLGGYGGFDHINSDENFQKYKTREYLNSISPFQNRDKYSPEYFEAINKKRYESMVANNTWVNGITALQKYREEHPELHAQAVAAAATPEAIQKKKDTFKKINHQQGEKNSQYGKCWISHPLHGSTRCMKDDLDNHIMQGWVKGRNVFK